MTKMTIDKAVVEQVLKDLVLLSRLANIDHTAPRPSVTALEAALSAAAEPQEEKQPEFFCGVDVEGGIATVSVLRRCPDGVAELVHHEEVAIPAPAVPSDDVIWTKADEERLDAAIRSHYGPAVPDAAKPEPCPVNGDTTHGCKNRHQCWEPCGELGNSAEHARLAPKETQDAVNAALGLAAKPETQGPLEAWLCREMPAGTVIGDPKWWAQRIARAAILAAPVQEPVTEALLYCRDDYNYLLGITENKDNLHGWLRMRLANVDLVLNEKGGV